MFLLELRDCFIMELPFSSRWLSRRVVVTHARTSLRNEIPCNTVVKPFSSTSSRVYGSGHLPL